MIMIINFWTCTASAAYASKIMTLTTAHSLPRDTLVYRVLLGSFCRLDHVCVEPGCVPSSEYAFKNYQQQYIYSVSFTSDAYMVGCISNSLRLIITSIFYENLHKNDPLSGSPISSNCPRKINTWARSVPNVDVASITEQLAT